MYEFNLSHHTPILQSLLNTNQEITGYSVIYLVFLYKLINTILLKGRCSVPLYLQLFAGGLMSHLHYLCLFVCDGF